MNPWLKKCEAWLLRHYQENLGLTLTGDPVRLRWFGAESLIREVDRSVAQSMAVEDAEIGWILFLIPYDPARLEHQVNEALSARSRLMREGNYTGKEKAQSDEDADSSWRIGLIWIVSDTTRMDWQSRILELRRESGAADEISLDAIQVVRDDIDGALDCHGLPRLLLHTRALLAQTASEVDLWLSADERVLAQMQQFSKNFESSAARALAHQLEDRAKAFRSPEVRATSSDARRFSRFQVRRFRNLQNLEVVADKDDVAQAIVLFGPNATGKSSFAEALSLAAFKSSPRLEQFLRDTDHRNPTSEMYVKSYLRPCDRTLGNVAAEPAYVWGDGAECHFAPSPLADGSRPFDGVILNQEDSIEFTDMSRIELASRVLKGYSAITDHLSSWLEQEERSANVKKIAFTQKHGLSSAIRLRSTAYDRLAQEMLSEQLRRPSPEFLGWLEFLVPFSAQDGEAASRLLSAWKDFQSNSVARLAATLSKRQADGASEANISEAIREIVDAFDSLAARSTETRERVVTRLGVLREEVDQALSWIELWGSWLSAPRASPDTPDVEAGALRADADNLAKQRTDVELRGQMLRGRLDLLDKSREFLSRHWVAGHPDICPVCDSNVTDRHGIESVVAALRTEVEAGVVDLRSRYAGIQQRQKELETKLKVLGAAVNPVSADDQSRLRSWLAPFIPSGEALEEWLIDSQRRSQLKSDIARMKTSPDVPTPYSDPAAESHRLATEFISLAIEADSALDVPLAIDQVKKKFDQSMEAVLVEHLPRTMGKVWQEITLTLTTAAWLLPAKPTLKIESRGKSLSVQLENRDLSVRYIYNAAERHVLGLAWFFTLFIAKRRFDEAWLLLDDPAQEMDQPSFRELVRFWETFLRFHRRKSRPLTLIVTLHQEERALAATRGTNGRLYVLGWRKTQDDSAGHPSVKKIVLLAPGYHPMKPEAMFAE